MSRLQTLKIFNDRMEAEFAESSLRSLGIESFVRGAKEYTSHILGGQAGRYELLVSANEFDRAKIHLYGPKLQLAEPEIIEDLARKKSNYLKKAIIFSIYSTVFLPFVFNYFAIQNMFCYQKLEANGLKKNVLSVLIIFLQFPILIYVYLILRKFL